jgi:carboxylesterase type B
LTAIPADQASKTTEQILQRLKITPDRLDQLQTIPFAQLIDVLRPAQGTAPLPGAGPVLDGKSLTVHPFDPTAPAQSARVPFLTGTTATETTFFDPDDQLMPIDDATLRQRVKSLLKVDDGEADRMIALYRKNQPGRDNIDLYLRMETDNSRFRTGVDTQAERKAAQRGAPCVCLPIRVLLARPPGALEVDALHGDSIRLRQPRGWEDLHGHQSRGTTACRPDERGMGGIRAHGAIRIIAVSRSGQPSMRRDGRRWCLATRQRSSMTLAEKSGSR